MLNTPEPVNSVNGLTGDVIITAADLGVDITAYVLKAGDTMTGDLFGRNLGPTLTGTYLLGSSGLYYKEIYATRHYLNSTAFIDGATAGIAEFSALMFDSVSLMDANNTTDRGGGAGMQFNQASAFNRTHSSIYTNINNTYAGTRTARLAGYETQVQMRAANQTASHLPGYYTSITPNATNGVITRANVVTGRLNVQNVAGQSIGSMYYHDIEAVNSNLAGGNTMTITTLAGFHMPSLGSPTGVTITNRRGVWIEDASATNIFAGSLGAGITTSPTSTLQSGGSVAAAIASKTADYTLTSSDHTVLFDATSASRTATLPAASGCTGRIYNIKKIDSSANTVIIDGNSSETIDGATTAVLTTQYESITIQSDGSNWWVI